MQTQRVHKAIAQESKRRAGFFRRASESRLDNFQVPVAQITPEESVNRIGGLIKAIIRQALVYLAGNSMETRINPAVLQLVELRFWCAGGLVDSAHAVQVHEHETRRIPDFVGEVAIAFRAAFTESDIGA